MKRLITLSLALAIVSISSNASEKLSRRSISRQNFSVSGIVEKQIKPSKVTAENVKMTKSESAKKITSAARGIVKNDKVTLLKSKKVYANEANQEILADESFACLSAGSETNPVAVPVDDYYNIEESIIGEANYGFGGEGIYQAGGQLYINTQDDWGYMWTPDFKGHGNYTVSFDCKIVNGQGKSDYICLDFMEAVDYETGIDQYYQGISDSWKTITFEVDGTTAEANFDYIYFIVYSDECDVLIKNFVVKASFPAILAPTAIDYTEFDGTSFVANWQAVEGATSYLLSVAEFDMDNFAVTDKYFMQDKEVEGTSFKVEGITPGVPYAYFVKASNGTDISSPSNYILMDKLMTPENIKAELDNDIISVSWDAVPGANAYEADLYEVFVAPADTDKIISDCDFSTIKSSGTIASPEIPDDLQIEDLPQAPGWLFTFPVYADGAIGIQDNALYSAFFGIYATLDSPYIDLSSATSVKIEAEMASGSGSAAIIALAAPDENGEYGLVDYKITDALTGEFTKVSCTLSGSGENAFIRFMADDPATEDADPNIFFKSLKVSVPMEAGDSYTELISYTGVSTNSCTFSVNKKENTEYAVEVTAATLSADGYVDLISDKSARVKVEDKSGIEDVSVDNFAPVQYFDINGRSIAQPSQAGLYIVKQGAKASKVLIK